MRELRERGIYKTPNGQTLVASKCRQTTSTGERIFSRIGNQLCCFLFGRYEWAFHGAPDYEVSQNGNILPLKQTSGWRAEELIDTGATAGSH